MAFKEINWDAVRQIGVTIGMSFIPLMLAAFMESNTNGSSFIDLFISFFKGGEMGLYILSICGSITWLIVVKRNIKKSIWQFWMATFGVALPLVIASMYIGSNPSFTYDLPPSALVLLSAIYIVAIYCWYLAIVAKEEGDKKVEQAQAALEAGRYSDKEAELLQDILGQRE